MTVLRKPWILAAICLLALAPAALASHQRFATIDYPDATATWVFGINPSGDVVGGYSTTADLSDEHGFVLHDGTFTSYDYPGATWTELEGITPQGDIVGQFGLADNTTHGLLLRKGRAYGVDVPQRADQPQGLPNTMPVHINPDGTIVGCYHLSDSGGNTMLDTMFGFVRTVDGRVRSFEMSRSMHNGINPAGDVVGISYNAAGVVAQSYLIHHGTVSWFSFPGSTATQAWDIGPTGAVVGFHRTASGIHGFVMERGAWTSFDVPGAAQTRAYGVNDDGDVVGYYVDSTGYHGFLFSRGRDK